MERQEIVSAISRIVTKTIGVTDPDPNTSVFSIGADSLDHTEIIMGIEAEFRLRILDDEAVELKSIEQMASHVMQKIEIDV